MVFSSSPISLSLLAYDGMMVTNFGTNWKYWLYMQLSLNLIIIIMANLNVLHQLKLKKGPISLLWKI